MRIYTTQEMQSLDQATFDRLGMPSAAIMESAGRQVAEVVWEQFQEEACGSVVVLCGPGNNGGDGYVAARLLQNLGCSATVISLKDVDSLRGDSLTMGRAWHASGGADYVLGDAESLPEEVLAQLEDATLIIDALFGTGFSGAPRGIASDLIEFVNELDAPIVSIDVPSGVDAGSGGVRGTAVRSWTTVAVQCLKVGHVAYPGAAYAGSVVVVDVGIQESFAPVEWPSRELLTTETVGDLVQQYFPGSPVGHKGTRGHLLVAGGARGRVGAVKLSGGAALYAGAGLVTLGVPGDVAGDLSPVLEELMCETLSPDAGCIEALLNGKSAAAIGPGLGESEEAQEILQSLLAAAVDSSLPVLLDADALNIAAGNCAAAEKINDRCIITPHPGEAARLLGISTAEVQVDRLNAVSKLVEKFQCTCVLKGARTLIADPEGGIYVNPAADDALGTAGSGDVLTGIIGALLARNIPALEAAIIGVFVHGLAGEYCSVFEGRGSSVLAGEIAERSGILLQDLALHEADSTPLRSIVLPSWVPHMIDFENWFD